MLSQSYEDDICVVMLPGMDGTGIMFEPLLQCLPSNVNYRIIPIPNRLTALSSLLPMSLFKSTLVPKRLLKHVLFGSDHAPIELLHKSLSKVDTMLLRNRLQIMSNLTPPKKRLSISATIISASKDLLVNCDTQDGIAKVFLNTRQHVINVGHFVLQAAPQTLASIVIDVIKECSRR